MVRGMDPRIRIHTKMSWIRNTARGAVPLKTVGDCLMLDAGGRKLRPAWWTPCGSTSSWGSTWPSWTSPSATPRSTDTTSPPATSSAQTSSSIIDRERTSAQSTAIPNLHKVAVIFRVFLTSPVVHTVFKDYYVKEFESENYDKYI